MPDRILAVTFTNQAANEMRGRVETALSGSRESPLICTFHSFGARLLRRHASLLGYAPSFTICDKDDQVRIFKQLYKELQIDPNTFSVQQVRSIISRAKNRNQNPEAYLNHSEGQEASVIYEIFSSYQEYMRRAGFLDFDDLIVLTCRLLQEHPRLSQRYGELFQYLLIDEYQDTNAPQYELVKHLYPGTRQ